MRTVDEPFLDGMPEDPEPWIRPDSGVRMSAQQLDWMLQAALPHTVTGAAVEVFPQLAAIHLTVDDGLLTTAATDRYTMLRERRPISQTCEAFRFLLRTDDAKPLRLLLASVLRGLKDEARADEPVDLALELTDDGPTLRVLGQDLDVRFTQADGADDFPNVDTVLDKVTTAVTSGALSDFDAHLNPTLLARAVALQKSGRSSALFRYQRAGDKAPVLITTRTEDDDVVLAVMGVNLPDEEEPADAH